MSVSALFGDDEHTARDDPYTRLMKTRKWLYLFSALLFMAHMRIYVQSGLSEIIPFIRLGNDTLMHASLFGGAYMAFIYVLLANQYRKTHDIIMTERLTFRKDENVAEARNNIEQAEQKRGELIKSLIEDADVKIENNKSILDRIERSIRSLEGEIDVSYTIEREAEARLHELKVEAERLKTYLVSLQSDSANVMENPAVKAETVRISELQASYRAIIHSDPASRPGYVRDEYVIDLARIVSPLVWFLFASLNVFWPFARL